MTNSHFEAYCSSTYRNVISFAIAVLHTLVWLPLSFHLAYAQDIARECANDSLVSAPGTEVTPWIQLAPSLETSPNIAEMPVKQDSKHKPSPALNQIISGKRLVFSVLETDKDTTKQAHIWAAQLRMWGLAVDVRTILQPGSTNGLNDDITTKDEYVISFNLESDLDQKNARGVTGPICMGPSCVREMAIEGAMLAYSNKLRLLPEMILAKEEGVVSLYTRRLLSTVGSEFHLLHKAYRGKTVYTRVTRNNPRLPVWRQSICANERPCPAEGLSLIVNLVHGVDSVSDHDCYFQAHLTRRAHNTMASICVMEAVGLNDASGCLSEKISVDSDGEGILFSDAILQKISLAFASSTRQ